MFDVVCAEPPREVILAVLNGINFLAWGRHLRSLHAIIDEGRCLQQQEGSSADGKTATVVAERHESSPVPQDAPQDTTQEADIFGYLRQIKSFEHLSDRIILQVGSKMSSKSYAKGSIIIKKGQPGDTFYMIKSGKVGYSPLDDGKIVGGGTKGQHFGELSLLHTEGTKCSATVTARTACVCYTLSRKAFDELLKPVVAHEMDDIMAEKVVPEPIRNHPWLAEEAYRFITVVDKVKYGALVLNRHSVDTGARSAESIDSSIDAKTTRWVSPLHSCADNGANACSAMQVLP